MPETQDWAAPLASPVTQVGPNAITATEAGAQTVLTLGVAGKRVTLVGLTITADPTATGPGELRDWCVIQASGATSGTVLALGAISPEQPSLAVPILYGAAQAATGEDVRITATTRGGSGSQQLMYVLWYYVA